MTLEDHIKSVYLQVHQSILGLRELGHSVGYPETIEIEWEGVKLSLPFYGWIKV